MKVVLSEQHRRLFPNVELSGGGLVRPFNCPEHWDTIVIALDARQLYDGRVPVALVMEGGHAVDEIGTNTVNVLAGFEA